MKKPALFLDRDGVINVDYGYVYRREDFVFVDGIFDLVRKAKALNYLVIVVTNQAGIGRGYYTEADFWNLMDWVKTEFEQRAATIDDVYFCPYHPEGIGEYRKECKCRKPQPGMILQAAMDWNIDLESSFMIGDKISDIEAGSYAGVGNLFLIGARNIYSKIKYSNISYLYEVFI